MKVFSFSTDLVIILLLLCSRLSIYVAANHHHRGAHHHEAIISTHFGVKSPDNYTDGLDRLVNISISQRHYVLDTFKVPFSWVNPSITLHDDNKTVIMIWRLPDKRNRDRIGFMHMDRHTWTVTKPPDYVELIVENKTKRLILFGEDARIFRSNGRLFLVYNTHFTNYEKRHFYFTPMQYEYITSKEMGLNNELTLYVNETPIAVNCEHEMGNMHQKNWAPFDYIPMSINASTSTSAGAQSSKMPSDSDLTSMLDPSIKARLPSFPPPNYPHLGNETYGSTPTGELLFIYSVVPHRIMQLKSTSPDMVRADTVFLSLINDYHSIWKWGSPRGGSPAILIDDTRYLVFFHSSGRFNQRYVITYFMGAYCFERYPPFRITHISPEPIIHPDFYNYTAHQWAYRKVDFITFPMGFIFDDNFIHVSYGRNDRDSWVLKLHKQNFLNSLVPVTSRVLGVSKLASDGRIVPFSYQGLPYNFTHPSNPREVNKSGLSKEDGGEGIS